MGILKEEHQKESNKSYESFIAFVAFSLIIKILPYIEKFSSNLLLKLILGLLFVGVIVHLLIRNTKLPILLKKFCINYKIKIYYLFIIYIIIYLVVFYSFFD